MRVLVTGGAGFVGSNLVARLLDEENEVTLFDNLSRSGSEKNLEWLKKKGGKLSVVIDDIRGSEKIEEAAKDQDVIYHAAGQVAVTTSVSDPRTDYEINATGTFNALEAARKSNTDPVFIFTSTNKVYGNLEDLELIELEKRYEFKNLKNGVPSERPIAPHTPYGCSKAAADSYCLDYHKIYGLKTVVFRMSCIYGLHQFGNVDQGWISHFIITHILKKPITIYGDGKQVRDVLFIDDLVDAFLMATKGIEKTKGNPYAIGGGKRNTISLLELMEHIERRTKEKYKKSFDEWRPADQKVYYSDLSKAKKDFGWAPKISAREGIDRLYDWTKENINLFR